MQCPGAQRNILNAVTRPRIERECLLKNRIMETERLQRDSYKRNTSYAMNLKLVNTSI
jgi:hypothetical protein